jgi:hypothetical protein
LILFLELVLSLHWLPFGTTLSSAGWLIRRPLARVGWTVRAFPTTAWPVVGWFGGSDILRHLIAVLVSPAEELRIINSSHSLFAHLLTDLLCAAHLGSRLLLGPLAQLLHRLYLGLCTLSDLLQQSRHLTFLSLGSLPECKDQVLFQASQDVAGH